LKTCPFQPGRGIPDPVGVFSENGGAMLMMKKILALVILPSASRSAAFAATPSRIGYLATCG
jgi:hypothetical protein